jgi:cysteine desulfurase
MTAKRIYLDYNASAPLLPAARAAMIEALDLIGNPSSVHAEGRRQRALVEEARRRVAVLVNAEPANVFFTSGATEAAAMTLVPEWRLGRAPLAVTRLCVLATDHPCLLSGGRFTAERRIVIGVDGDGRIDLAALERVLTLKDPGAGPLLVALHAANNETGVVQPWREVARLVKAAGGYVLLDAVQAAGRLPLDVVRDGVDFLILSAHKIGGPKGVGALVAAGSLVMPEPLVRGGGQEKGHRAGTENVAGIAGFGAAASVAATQLALMPKVAALRDRFEQAVFEIFPAARIAGAGVERLANTSCFVLPGIKAETAQIAFDLEGVALSSGAACSSGKVGPSHVLSAMGFAAEESGLRVSIGVETGEAELARFKAALKVIAARTSSAAQAA